MNTLNIVHFSCHMFCFDQYHQNMGEMLPYQMDTCVIFLIMHVYKLDLPKDIPQRIKIIWSLPTGGLLIQVNLSEKYIFRSLRGLSLNTGSTIHIFSYYTDNFSKTTISYSSDLPVSMLTEITVCSVC